MEAGRIFKGAELVLYPVGAEAGEEVKLTILPIPHDYQFPTENDTATAIKSIGQFVTGWNLTDDGVAIECNDENKAKYLGYILRMKVKAGDDGGEDLAISEIAKFASDVNNFLGN